MGENIYNLYLYIDNEILNMVGATVHYYEGNDEEKLQFLKSLVESDLKVAQKFNLPERFKLLFLGNLLNAIDYPSYRDLSNKGHGLLVFEKAFTALNASANPLMIITPVRDGQIFIEGVTDIKSSNQTPPEVIHIEKPDPWYHSYLEDGNLHIDKLINDDFFEAIKVLFNRKLYVSSIKLLVICLDTISFLEYDDTKGNFIKWVDTYMNLKKLGISSEELWEFRNSVLHMTNLDSRRVKANKVRRLLFYVSNEQAKYIDESDEGKYFNLKDLIYSIDDGIGNWGNSYNLNREKLKDFFDRYDRIISDIRLTNIYYKNH